MDTPLNPDGTVNAEGVWQQLDEVLTKDNLIGFFTRNSETLFKQCDGNHCAVNAYLSVSFPEYVFIVSGGNITVDVPKYDEVVRYSTTPLVRRFIRRFDGLPSEITDSAGFIGYISGERAAKLVETVYNSFNHPEGSEVPV